MNKLENAFKEGKALIPFIAAGQINIEMTEEIIYALDRSGADIIEIGIPFSDPVADTPVIQGAYSETLKNGLTTDELLKMLREVRKATNIPIVIRSYFNSIFVYGVDRFLRNCVETGIDGLLILDVPFEEREEIEPDCIEKEIDLITLVTPTSMDRIKMLTKPAKSYIYCVVTPSMKGSLEEMLYKVNEMSQLPCIVDHENYAFDTTEQFSKHISGIRIGSDIVELVDKYKLNCISVIEAYIKGIKGFFQDMA